MILTISFYKPNNLKASDSAFDSKKTPCRKGTQGYIIRFTVGDIFNVFDQQGDTDTAASFNLKIDREYRSPDHIRRPAPLVMAIAAAVNLYMISQTA